MTAPVSRLVCGGCGFEVPPGQGMAALPVRCPNAGDGGDHVLMRELDGGASGPSLRGDTTAHNPFLRWRKRLHSWHFAAQLGIGDGEFVALVDRLNRAVAAVDRGRSFRQTPLVRSQRLGDGLGMGTAVWVKDETGNVSGSHKGRHLFGLLLGLELARLRHPQQDPPPLAIASCGNAALAAAVLAKAAQWQLQVFIPPDASPKVVQRLQELGAQIAVCQRRDGEAGDPCVLRFQEAVAGGAVPFACQGSENGHAIEGGETLGWEIADAVVEAHGALDRVFVQVGGGALCGALARGLDQAVRAWQLPAMPRLHPVQARACYPLARAYERLARAMDQALGHGGQPAPCFAETDLSAPAIAARSERAQRIASAWLQPAVQQLFAAALHHRDAVMWPWDAPAHSIAHGILDDETYDWAATLRGTFASGGYPVVVSEANLAQANWLGQSATGIAVDATGSAGLAGLLALRLGAGDLAVRPEEAVAVVFTGIER